MFASLLLFVALTLDGVICDDQSKINASEPLTLTISPKIWNLFETKANIINDAVTSLKFPEQSGQEGAVRYRLWDGKVEHFSISKWDISFEDIRSGVHLKLNGVKFRASINGKVEVGKTFWGKYIPLIWMSGGITVTSEAAILDVNLVWKNFKFTPTVKMDSNVNIGFTSSLWMLYFLKSKIEKEFRHRINIEVSNKLVEAINLQVNPRLQKLQQTMMSMGYDHYDVDWAVQNNVFRISLRPKSWGAIASPIKPINHMLCVNLNMLTAVHEVSKRMKREAVQSPNQSTNGLDFTCLAKKFECRGKFCTICTDIDISPGPVDILHNCVPSI
ncbi:hypothetical protein Y032_0374g217 [Ancylostoma ceylanicum]|nr:hypothetical protein Y032_0374g217 [Ancylostoma ceylanicum]